MLETVTGTGSNNLTYFSAQPRNGIGLNPFMTGADII